MTDGVLLLMLPRRSGVAEIIRTSGQHPGIDIVTTARNGRRYSVSLLFSELAPIAKVLAREALDESGPADTSGVAVALDASLASDGAVHLAHAKGFLRVAPRVPPYSGAALHCERGDRSQNMNLDWKQLRPLAAALDAIADDQVTRPAWVPPCAPALLELPGDRFSLVTRAGRVQLEGSELEQVLEVVRAAIEKRASRIDEEHEGGDRDLTHGGESAARLVARPPSSSPPVREGDEGQADMGCHPFRGRRSGPGTADRRTRTENADLTSTLTTTNYANDAGNNLPGGAEDRDRMALGRTESSANRSTTALEFHSEHETEVCGG